ncbi:MAG: transposase [Pseudomonadales bacterium]|nr:transposase [Pseudomonadales bacterium]
MFSPLDFLSKLAALIPRPRYNLVRYHGVLVPNSKLRSCIVPKQRKKPKKKGKSGEKDHASLMPQSEDDLLAPLTWAQRIKACISDDGAASGLLNV